MQYIPLEQWNKFLLHALNNPLKKYNHLNHHHCEDLKTYILVNIDATQNTTLIEVHCYIALQPISLKSTTSKHSSPMKVTDTNTCATRRTRQLQGNPQQSTEI
jgi:hypothetical protein